MPRVESGKAPNFQDAVNRLGADEASTAFLGDILALPGFQRCWQGKSWAAVETDDQGALIELYVDMPGVELEGAPALPTSVGGCAKLRKLCLRAMGLGSLCEELGRCVELKDLCVCANPLSGDVPESLNNLTALVNFNIDDCHMTGRFLPMELFKRLGGTEGTYIYLANNDFGDINFADFGLNQYTTGELRPMVPDTSVNTISPTGMNRVVQRGRVAVCSFPGKEFLQWMLMLIRNSTQRNPDCLDASELCVFLSAYAAAQSVDEAVDEWHAGGKRGSPTCEMHGKFFEAAANASSGGTVFGHKKFGCMWFHEWALNQVRAAMAGYKRFLVFTMCTSEPTAIGPVGTCQKAEYAFLKSMQTAYPDVQIGVAPVDNLEFFMREPLEFWNTSARLNEAPVGCQDIHESPIPFPREEYEKLVVESQAK